MNNTGVMIAGFVLAISLVVSAVIIRDAYMAKVEAPSIPYINADLSKVENALSNRDSMMLYDLAAYLGINTENLAAFKEMIEKNKIEGLPYIKINGNFVFSKRAVDQWLYDASLKRYEAWGY